MPATCQTATRLSRDLDALREELGATTADVADAAGIDQFAVDAYFAGAFTGGDTRCAVMVARGIATLMDRGAA